MHPHTGTVEHSRDKAQCNGPVGPIRTAVITDPDELKEYRDAWNALSRQVAPKIPTSSYAWISAYFEYLLASGQSWCCITAQIDHELVGVLPLVVSRIPKLGIEWLKTPMSGHIIAVSPLLSHSNTGQILSSLLETAWISHPNAIWLQISDLPARAPCAEYLSTQLHLKIKTRIGRFLRVDTDQRVYQASLSRNFRSNQHKAANKLKKLTAAETTFLCGADASEEQLTEFMSVEASGWKGRAGTAILKSNELCAFYRTLARRLAAAGWLEWHFLRADSRTIAGNLAIRFDGVITVWKLGYDEDYKHYSPGGMLFQALLDRAFADPEIDEVDLLTNAAWYDNWRMDAREYHRIRIYNGRRFRSVVLGLIPNAMGYVPLRNRRLRSYLRALVEWFRKPQRD